MKLLINRIAEAKMKTKLFLLILLFVIPFGCKEERKIEIIPTNEVYFPLNELNEYPTILEQSLTKEAVIAWTDTLKQIYQSLREEEKKKFVVDYRFLVNENGSVDKIQIINSNYPKIDNLLLKLAGELQFTAAIKNGEKVKFIFPWGRYDSKFFNPQNVNLPELGLGQDIYFVRVEEMPEPIGGMYSIQSKIKYPEDAKRNGVEGKVFIQAFIDEMGNVVETKVIKGAGYGLDEAALTAVKETKFFPGKQKGKPVKVQVSIPIVFKLESNITIQEILDKLKWNNNEGNIIRIANSNFSLTGRPVVKESNNRSRVIQFSDGSLYGIKTYRWIFTFENDSLSLISIEFKSTSSSDKSKTYSALKNEIEKISLTKIQAQPNEWILSFDNKTLAGLKLFPGGRTADITILLSSNKLINEHSLK